jgi:hypothetical protein
MILYQETLFAPRTPCNAPWAQMALVSGSKYSSLSRSARPRDHPSETMPARPRDHPSETMPVPPGSRGSKHSSLSRSARPRDHPSETMPVPPGSGGCKHSSMNRSARSRDLGHLSEKNMMLQCGSASSNLIIQIIPLARNFVIAMKPKVCLLSFALPIPNRV